MSRTFPSFVNGDSVARRLAARVSRGAHQSLFSGLLRACRFSGGAAAVVFSEDANAIAFLILQIALYFVSLFALLAGASSAQAEREEWQLLFTQPVPRAGLCRREIHRLLCRFLPRSCFCFFSRALLARIQHAAAALSETLLLAAAFPALGLGRRISRPRSRAGAHRRRERVVASAFRCRSRRSFRGALGVRSKIARSLGARC